MIRKEKLFLLGMVIVLVFQACTLLPNANNKLLDGTEWELVYIRESAPIAGSTTTITFDGKEVHGVSGCNTYFGDYQTNGKDISFGALAMTEMACMDPEGVMQQEQEYLAFLSEVVALNIENDLLMLVKGNQEQLTFRRMTNN